MQIGLGSVSPVCLSSCCHGLLMLVATFHSEIPSFSRPVVWSTCSAWVWKRYIPHVLATAGGLSLGSGSDSISLSTLGLFSATLVMAGTDLSQAGDRGLTVGTSRPHRLGYCYPGQSVLFNKSLKPAIFFLGPWALRRLTYRISASPPVSGPKEASWK